MSNKTYYKVKHKCYTDGLVNPVGYVPKIDNRVSKTDTNPNYNKEEIEARIEKLKNYLLEANDPFQRHKIESEIRNQKYLINTIDDLELWNQ